MSVTLFNIIYSAIFGAITGSFLNVIILSSPKNMIWQWKNDASEFLIDHLGQKNENNANNILKWLKKFHKNNLLERPKSICLRRSHCPNCNHLISWYENIPLLSWIFLKGKCKECSCHISYQYPLIEFITSLLFVVAVLKWGVSIDASIMILFFCFMICLGAIDWNTQLLPDTMIYTTLWGSLLLSLSPWHMISIQDSILGAFFGYMSLWSIYWLFKLTTGKEGMGYGDFKLFAALGAFFGYFALIPILFMSAISGTIIGIGLLISKKQSKPFAFGPFLIVAAIIYSFFQKDIHYLLFMS